jgi:DUF4097 and DUF4098 domain-containing protein YvlB
MKNKISAALFLLLCLMPPLSAADVSKSIGDAPQSDIFINTAKENITVLPAPAESASSSIQWQKKLCEVTINKPAPQVTEINITPKKQNAFVKKLLRIPRTTCSIRLYVSADKNIYASSDTGDIRFFAAHVKSAKLYTAEGVMEISDFKGNLSAETLTSRITLTNIESEDLKLKTASGNIYASGLKIKNTDILNTSGKSKMQGISESLVFYSSEGSLWAKWDALPGNKMLNISARSFAGDIKIIMPRGVDITQCKHNIALKSIYGTAKLENN